MAMLAADEAPLTTGRARLRLGVLLLLWVGLTSPISAQLTTAAQASSSALSAATADAPGAAAQTPRDPRIFDKPTLAQPPAPTMDVRVLVDVSGSMRLTDPHNLRRPALELLVQLLDADSRAGVWQFGEFVTPLTDFAGVTPAWRRQAQTAAHTIGSRERYTNLAAALSTAMAAGAPVVGQTHIILLTDGKLDIDPAPARNQAARADLLREQLPRWFARGIKVHTIALSQDADAALLRELSRATDGLFATALTAEDLIGIFAKIFAQASAKDELPLTHNRFKVDAAIEEFSALIFRADPAAAVQLIAPNGLALGVQQPPQTQGGSVEVTQIAPATGVMNPDFNQVRWWRGANFDLVTVTRPSVGEWRLEAQLKPGSRISIVSNLKLRVAPLRTQVAVGDRPLVDIELQAQGAPLADTDFMALLSAEIGLQSASGQTVSGQAAAAQSVAILTGADFTDGRAQVTLAPFTLASPTQLVVRVDGKSFERQWTHEFQINQAQFAIEQQGHASESAYRERIVIRPLLPGLTQLRASAAVTRDGQALQTLDAQIQAQADPQQPQQLFIDFVTETPGTYAMAIAVSAFTDAGVPVWETKLTQPFTLNAVAPPAPSLVQQVREWGATPLLQRADRIITRQLALGAAALLLMAALLLVWLRRRRRRNARPAKRNHFAVVPPPADSAVETAVPMSATPPEDMGLDLDLAIIPYHVETAPPDAPAAPIFPLDDLSDTDLPRAPR